MRYIFISKSLSNLCFHVFHITIHLRREARDHSARRNVEPREQEIANAPKVQPQEEVSNIEFLEAIRTLSQVVTNQIGQ